MARFAEDRPETGGALWDGTRKAWPLLFSASSYPLGGHSQSDAVGHAGVSRGKGCRETPLSSERIARTEAKVSRVVLGFWRLHEAFDH